MPASLFSGATIMPLLTKLELHPLSTGAHAADYFRRQRESVGFTARLTILSANLSRNITQLDEKPAQPCSPMPAWTAARSCLAWKIFFDPANITAQHHVLQALKAHKIFKRDIDYIVQDGQVVIVDEFTGRLAWPGAAIRTACTRLSKPGTR